MKKRLMILVAMLALTMAVSVGPASADDWDHGCWEWSRVLEEWQWECDDGFWWDRDHKDFAIFVKDFDRHDKNRHDKNHGDKWDWRD